MRKVCVFTGTRAEYGILRPVMKEVERDPDLRLQVLASGAHLSQEFGLTYCEIEADGFIIDEKVEMLLSSDSDVGICKSMGLGLGSYCEAFQRLQPDIMVILGDRFEAFAAAAAAMICRIPIAHIHGGEATFGAYDESMRHSITKMAHLHFTCAEEYRRRVVQLGEHPDTVFNAGALGVENIRRISLIDRQELGKSINFSLDEPFVLVTFHPVTLENSTAAEQFGFLLEALDVAGVRVIFTKANADTDGRVINTMIDRYAADHPERAIAFTSMGMQRYLSAMKYCAAVVGNSSSGIIEAPAFKVPTVNIGDRQSGRVRALSVIDCEPETDLISAALKRALDPAFLISLQDMDNPYERPKTARTIKDIIKKRNLDNILKKRFYDLPNLREVSA